MLCFFGLILFEVVEITNWGVRLPQNRFGWWWLLFEELWPTSLFCQILQGNAGYCRELQVLQGTSRYYGILCCTSRYWWVLSGTAGYCLVLWVTVRDWGGLLLSTAGNPLLGGYMKYPSVPYTVGYCGILQGNTGYCWLLWEIQSLVLFCNTFCTMQCSAILESHTPVLLHTTQKYLTGLGSTAVPISILHYPEIPCSTLKYPHWPQKPPITPSIPSTPSTPSTLCTPSTPQ